VVTKRRSETAPWVALLVLVVGGCGGGKAAVVTGTGDLGLFKIESGSYAVSNLDDGGDGCALALDSGSFATLAVRNDGQGDVDLGDYRSTASFPNFVPGAYTGGSGHFSDGTHGMTETQTHVVADDGMTPCNYDLTLTTVLSVTAADRLHVALTHRDSAISACTTPPGPSCTSSWSFDLTLSPPNDLAMADAAR
jgi:hypothetical protein